MRVKDKVAIVTGGASGIGLAIAERFVAEGACVLIADINGKAANIAANKIAAASIARERIASVAADISQNAAAESIIRVAITQWGRVDILVNNAASFVHKRVEDATPEDWQKVMAVNVVGTSLVSKHAVAAMKLNGGGNIVNIASINGLIAMPDWMTYNASKAAVVEISKSMAMDLAAFDIRVNCICPGVTQTPALEEVFTELGMTGQDVFDQIVSPRCLIKRYATAEDIAFAALYLASDEASYVTGATLVVDGGFTA